MMGGEGLKGSGGQALAAKSNLLAISIQGKQGSLYILFREGTLWAVYIRDGLLCVSPITRTCADHNSAHVCVCQDNKQL